MKKRIILISVLIIVSAALWIVFAHRNQDNEIADKVLLTSDKEVNINLLDESEFLEAESDKEVELTEEKSIYILKENIEEKNKYLLERQTIYKDSEEVEYKYEYITKNYYNIRKMKLHEYGAEGEFSEDMKQYNEIVAIEIYEKDKMTEEISRKNYNDKYDLVLIKRGNREDIGAWLIQKEYDLSILANKSIQDVNIEKYKFDNKRINVDEKDKLYTPQVKSVDSNRYKVTFPNLVYIWNNTSEKAGYVEAVYKTGGVIDEAHRIATNENNLHLLIETEFDSYFYIAYEFDVLNKETAKDANIKIVYNNIEYEPEYWKDGSLVGFIFKKDIEIKKMYEDGYIYFVNEKLKVPNEVKLAFTKQETYDKTRKFEQQLKKFQLENSDEFKEVQYVGQYYIGTENQRVFIYNDTKFNAEEIYNKYNNLNFEKYPKYKEIFEVYNGYPYDPVYDRYFQYEIDDNYNIIVKGPLNKNDDSLYFTLYDKTNKNYRRILLDQGISRFDTHEFTKIENKILMYTGSIWEDEKNGIVIYEINLEAANNIK